MRSFSVLGLRAAVFFLLVGVASPVVAAPPSPDVAFYYGANPPVELLTLYDWVVVEPDNVSDPTPLQAFDTTVFAYVSVVEARPSRAWFANVSRQWIRTRNPVWDSEVLDVSNAEWHSFLIDRVMRPLWTRGYRGFFLDTLDSFQIGLEDPKEIQKQVTGLIRLIRRMRSRFPGVKLLFNRGFEILPQVHKEAHGVVAEDLFHGWDHDRKIYRAAKKPDTKWLLRRLEEIRDVYRLPVIVIDYRAPQDRALARKDAARILKLGFSPWITNFSLDLMGVGRMEAEPRRVLMIYDSQWEKSVPYSQAHRTGAMPLEYLGYAVDYLDVRGPLPSSPLKGRYAGLVTWLGDQDVERLGHYRDWFLKTIAEGTKVVVLGRFGFYLDSRALKTLGLNILGTAPEGALRVTHSDPMFNYEVPLVARRHAMPDLHAAKQEVRPLLEVQDQEKRRYHPAGLAPWGGFALAPYLIKTFGDDDLAWNLDPFDFYARALQLKPIPRADITTENGRRLLLAHIDGDGMASRAEFPGSPFSGTVVLEEILKKYLIPQTVSVVEGETGAQGLYPKLSPQLERIAKSIFRLPHIEIASHAYSHPFKWQAFEAGAKNDHVHLPIPGYKASIPREIAGSVAYIDKNLAPPGKRCAVFLWTGNALPGEETVALTYRLGLSNLNGGDTLVTKDAPSMTRVSALGRRMGSVVQVYAPVMNENVYTNDWTGPFYGFRRVVETFELTETPRRIKPINIYYHFYSGSKSAALKALKIAYDWAVSQETLPVWVSEYSAKGRDFWDLALGRVPGGGYRVQGIQEIRNLRIDPQMGWPDLVRSEGVVGYRDGDSGRYLSFLPVKRALVYFSPRPPAQIHLVESNARVVQWSRSGNVVRLQLKGHLPVTFSVGAPKAKSCTLSGAGKATRSKGRGFTFHLDAKDTGRRRLQCR